MNRLLLVVMIRIIVIDSQDRMRDPLEQYMARNISNNIGQSCVEHDVQ